MKYLIFLLFFLLLKLNAYSDSTSTVKYHPLSIWAFGDVYYSYDFNQPQNHNRPYFLYSHNRHNEISLNNLIIGAGYESQRYRGAIAFHTGNYVRANYSSEPELLRFIYLASVGVEIFKNTWIDAGVLPSHIGSESAISAENLTLTRSIMAENSPYYESGVKVTWTNSSNLTFSGLILNGWQNITENNDNKALGTLIQYKIKPNLLLSSSSFLGKERPTFDTISSRRFFHNLYAQLELKKIVFLTSFDLGLQKNRIKNENCLWYSSNLILKYFLIDKLGIAGRLEYYRDKKGVIVNSGLENGFDVFSSSLNVDYQIQKNLFIRVEGRKFWSQDAIYEKGTGFSKSNTSIAASMAIKF